MPSRRPLRPSRTLLAGLGALGLLPIVPLAAQEAELAVAPSRMQYSLAVAGGFADLGRPGLSRETPGHLLIGLTARRTGFPLEVRAEALGVQQAGSSGTWVLSTNGVLPVGSLGVGAGAVQPYAIGGANFSTASGPVSALSWNVGGGLRYTGARFGVFSEVRWQQTYAQTFGTVGFTMRR
jgi:hypothetical protein